MMIARHLFWIPLKLTSESGRDHDAMVGLAAYSTGSVNRRRGDLAGPHQHGKYRERVTPSEVDETADLDT
jgi:hypothetical protein